MRIYERHKLLTKALIALGVEPKHAEDEACKIEHDIDDDTFHRIRDYYNAHMEPHE